MSDFFISKLPKPITPLTSKHSYKTNKLISPPADYETWCKADLWTIERGILLLLGVKELPLSGYGGIFHGEEKALVNEFRTVLEIALGSAKAGKLAILGRGYPHSLSEVYPADFIVWARSKGYTIHAALDGIACTNKKLKAVR